MALWTKEELLEALGNELLSHSLVDDLKINEVVIDGKKSTKNSLFLALKGEKNDAHDFLEQASTNGCTTFLLHTADALKKIPNSNFLLVKNTFIALYKLAEFSRNRSKAKIIAVTGSVGKTSSKEMLKLLFDSQGKTFATSGNLNNHIGLPLSLSNFSADYEYGIFEMGMNHLGEIEPLSKLTKPHIALITNVGAAHIEFFKNEEEIALAKSEIFLGVVEGGKILLNHDNSHFQFLKKRALLCGIKEENIFNFGEKNSSNYQLLHFKTTSSNNSVAEIKLQNDSQLYYEISTSNPATIFNSIATIACLDMLGNNLSEGISVLKNLEIFDGRGNVREIKIGEKSITVIDDSYNASLPSMLAGIDHAINLKNILGKKRVVIALGDMRELGEKSIELHEEVTNYLSQLPFDLAVLVGENMTLAAKNLPKNSYQTFSDSFTASLEIERLLQDGDILYIKGSRGTQMEKIINQNSVH